MSRQESQAEPDQQRPHRSASHPGFHRNDPKKLPTPPPRPTPSNKSAEKSEKRPDRRVKQPDTNSNHATPHPHPTIHRTNLKKPPTTPPSPNRSDKSADKSEKKPDKRAKQPSTDCNRAGLAPHPTIHRNDPKKPPTTQPRHPKSHKSAEKSEKKPDKRAKQPSTDSNLAGPHLIRESTGMIRRNARQRRAALPIGQITGKVPTGESSRARPAATSPLRIPSESSSE